MTSLPVEYSGTENLAKSGDARSFRASWMMALLFVCCHVPYVILYFNNLRGYSHYDFFPLALLASAFLLWQRWGGFKPGAIGFQRRTLGLFIGSMTVGLLAVAFSSSWIAYLGFLIAVSAVLLNTRDKETNKSNIALVVPLILLWQPPYSPNLTGDVVVTGYLQRICTTIVSSVLDVLRIAHVNTGTILSIPGRDMGVAEACSGVQSMFLYLAFTGLLSVFQRRHWLHGVILMVSTVAWTLLTNSLRILLIVMAAYYFEYDLTAGLVHDSLGYVLMIFGLGLILLFDYGLSGVFEGQRSNDNVRLKKKVGDPTSTNAPPAIRWSLLTISLSLIAFLILIAQSIDSILAFKTNRDKISFFSSNPILEVESELMPDNLLGLAKVGYRRENRERGADFGERSDIWTYSDRDNSVTVSFDQAFPGWHELTRCYENAGWKAIERRVVPIPERLVGFVEGSENSTAYGVLVLLRHPSGGIACLAFALVDRRTQVLEPPGKWDLVNSLYNRVKGRLSPSIRSKLFGGVAYQIQTLVLSRSEDMVDKDSETAIAILGGSLASLRSALRE